MNTDIQKIGNIEIFFIELDTREPDGILYFNTSPMNTTTNLTIQRQRGKLCFFITLLIVPFARPLESWCVDTIISGHKHM
jgi:hypothetical protein